MGATFTMRLLERLPEAEGRYYRLVLAVGRACTGKTMALQEVAAGVGVPCLNVNMDLSERLLDLTQKQRAVRVPALLDDILRAHGGQTIVLDNIEMLFAVELAQDPLRLLQGLARHRTVVAAWPGTFDGRLLTYAEPGHPEYRKYAAPEALLVNAVEDDVAVQAPESKDET